MRNLFRVCLFVCWCSVSVAAMAALEYDDDEIDLSYKDEKSTDENPGEGDQDQEIDWSIPAWPLADELIPVDVDLIHFPFRLMLDPRSLKVNPGRVIQYTAVLRSQGGVDNISFEAIRCSRSQYRRIAYGSGGEFHVIAQPKWEFYSDSGVNRYRQQLANDYFCSLNSLDPENEIIKKLKSLNAGSSNFSDDD